mgnify:CR=1 FL=1
MTQCDRYRLFLLRDVRGGSANSDRAIGGWGDRLRERDDAGGPDYTHDAEGTADTRSHDRLDRLTQETTPQGTVSYSYFANGLRQTMTVAGQAAMSYSHDAQYRRPGIAQGRGRSAFPAARRERGASCCIMIHQDKSGCP